jgi:hypothetical protein
MVFGFVKSILLTVFSTARTGWKLRVVPTRPSGRAWLEAHAGQPGGIAVLHRIRVPDIVGSYVGQEFNPVVGCLVLEELVA